jgi:hypothetical protein
VRHTLEIEQPRGVGRTDARARRLALLGLLAGLLPLALLVPMFIYQMEFMLYTWAWPTAGGLIGLSLSALALRRMGTDRRGRALAGAGLLLSGLSTVVALAGWVAMMAMMIMPAPAMPMQ